MVTKLLYSEKNEYEEVIMEIFSVNDEKFRKYGKVWNNIECTKLIKGMEHTPLPEDVIYVPSVDVIPNLTVFTEFSSLTEKISMITSSYSFFSEYNSLVTMKTCLSLSLQCHFFVFFQQCPMMGI